jgi:hypothetical protein
MEQIHFLYQVNGNNIVGAAPNNSFVKYISKGIPYYIYTEDEFKNFEGIPLEDLIIEGEPDGYGEMEDEDADNKDNR